MAIISLGTNSTSLQAQSELGKAMSSLAKNFQRLSSGLRINDASDDAAGLALASQLNSKAIVYSQAVRNVNDGVSAASIAESALTTLKNISERQLELSEEAANGTYSLTQRQALNTEANALVDEYNRIVSTTTFNGLSLFDPKLGTVLIQAGYGQAGALQIGFSNQLERPVGDGTFQGDKTYHTGGNFPQSVKLGDVNGDGKLDLVSTDYSGDVSVFLGNGDGTFQAAKTFQTIGTGTDSVTLGDLNGDGKLDIIAGDQHDNEVSVFLSNGDGTFQAAQIFQTGGNNPDSVTLGDVNGDGKLDFVTADDHGNDVSVFLNNGNGTFQAAKTFQAGGGNPQSVTLGDVNNDGKLDLITADSNNNVSVFLGNGNGTFQIAQTFQTVGIFPSSVTVGDVNDDGILDIVTADGGGGVSVFIGNNNGTFAAAKTFQTAGASPESVLLGDINGDGRLDIVTADAGGDVGVFLSNGDGTFQAVKTEAGGFLSSVALGDVNNDGRPDLVAADDGGNDVSVYIANGNFTSTAPYLNMNTQQGALDAVTTVTANLNRIEGQLGVIGATTSQFKFDIGNLQSESENFQIAAGRIQDVDVASELADLLRNQILQQAVTAVLAQANQEPSLVLKLLG